MAFNVPELNCPHCGSVPLFMASNILGPDYHIYCPCEPQMNQGENAETRRSAVRKWNRLVESVKKDVAK